MTAPRGARRIRTAAAAVATVVLAVLAHALGQGEVPPVAAVLPVVGAVWGIGYALSARRVAWWQILLLIGAAQGAIHGLSVVAAGPHGHAMTSIDPALMTTWHVVSTLATALLLAYGERVWWSFLSWISRRIGSLAIPLVVDRCRPGRPARPAVALFETALVGAVGMRAPPAPAL